MVYKLKTTLLVNLYEMSKGLDVLWANQQKIVELTKIKGFVQLTNEEEQTVRKEVTEERTKLQGIKKVTGTVRPPESNTNDKGT